MNLSKELADRFREVTLSGTFVAYTNYKKQLDDVNLATANTRIGDLNTIAALTFHIHYYIRGILNVFRGGDLEIRDKFAWDMPEITSEEQWDQLKNQFISDSEDFANFVEALPEDDLIKPFVNEKYGTYLRNMDAMIEHAYYHLGQVSLIKKMIRSSSSV